VFVEESMSAVAVQSRAETAATLSSIPDIPEAIDPGYIRFPNHLLERLWKFGNGTSLLVYLALLKHSRNGTCCWPKKDRIGHMTGLKRTAVREAMRHLEKLGLIETKNRSGRGNTYLIKPMLPTRKDRVA
jgi:biotin operon repressor